MLLSVFCYVCWSFGYYLLWVAFLNLSSVSKNWVICADLSLQENGDHMKYRNLASDHLRENTDIGPGAKDAFWGVSGNKGAWSCPLWKLEWPGRCCITGSPPQNPESPFSTPGLSHKTGRFGVLERISISSWITSLNAVHKKRARTFIEWGPFWWAEWDRLLSSDTVAPLIQWGSPEATVIPGSPAVGLGGLWDSRETSLASPRAWIHTWLCELYDITCLLGRIVKLFF